MKVTVKSLLRGKKLSKISSLGCFSKAKSEECNQKVWKIFDQFDVTILCLPTYFLKIGLHVLLKVATKGSLRGKKLWNIRFLGYFSKSKTEERKKNAYIFLTNLESLFSL